MVKGLIGSAPALARYACCTKLEPYYNAQLLYDDRGFAVQLTEPNETWTLWTAGRFGHGEEDGADIFVCVGRVEPGARCTQAITHTVSP